MAQYLRDAPIKHQYFTKRSDHDVLRFEISMNHAVCMGESHSVTSSLKLSQPISERSMLRRIVIETTAAHKLHSIKHSTISQRADVVNWNNSRVLEARNDLRFANHAIAKIVSDFRCVEDFDRDQPVELSIFGQIHGAHAATRQFFDERVLGGTEVRIAGDGPEMVQLVV